MSKSKHEADKQLEAAAAAVRDSVAPFGVEVHVHGARAGVARAIALADNLAESVGALRARCMGQHPAILQDLDGIRDDVVMLADALRDISDGER